MSFFAVFVSVYFAVSVFAVSVYFAVSVFAVSVCCCLCVCLLLCLCFTMARRERLGWRARIPVRFKRSSQSSRTAIDALFAVNSLRTRALEVGTFYQKVPTQHFRFFVHLVASLKSVQDCPPIMGYITAFSKSMLNWWNFNNQAGLRQKL